MRVLLDANVFISYLLYPREPGPIRRIINAAVLGRFTLLLPEALLTEFSVKVSRKPSLSSRITAGELHEFVSLLREISEEIPVIETKIPAVTRDPKDDYLLAYALVGEANYLVTGDRDLLALGQVDGVTIVTPRTFWELFER
jgi:putative PIN family toxin of toxin-antitoxin system